MDELGPLARSCWDRKRVRVCAFVACFTLSVCWAAPAAAVSAPKHTVRAEGAAEVRQRAARARARAGKRRPLRAAQARHDASATPDPFVAPRGTASAPHTGIRIASLAPGPSALLRQRAERLIRGQDFAGAAQALGPQQAPAAALLRARLAIGQNDRVAARQALAVAANDGNLSAYTVLERGRLALLEGEASEAAELLWPLANSAHFWAPFAVLPLAAALEQNDPNRLLNARAALGAKLPLGQPSAQSEWLLRLAGAEAAQGHAHAACELHVERYVRYPMVPGVLGAEPNCRALRPAEVVERIERLSEANRNDAAQAVLDGLPHDHNAQWPEALLCKEAFAQGMVARKRRHYAQAEAALGQALQHCREPALRRRIRYTQTKVVSIQDGLRAIEPIEAFARDYGTHSMVDDVLFWAGDSLQRRGRDEEASAYYRRIVALPKPDDQCVEALWRLAWMAYRRGDPKSARRALSGSLSGRCPHEPWTLARAHYWLGRLDEQQQRPAAAEQHYRAASQAAPLHYYAQSALGRLAAHYPAPRQRALWQRMAAPKPPAFAHSLCPSTLALQPAFSEGLYLLQRGLTDEARAAFVALHRQPKLFSWERAAPLRQCGRRQAVLLLCALLEQSGAYREARARLYSEFGRELSLWPNQETVAIWQRAYPLAFREPLAMAESESGLPPYLLQALAREESTFDPEIVSWAEAGGLTQLLLSSGQQAGRSLRPPVGVQTLDQLLEPYLNARLGGALLGLFGRRLEQSWPLALAAYNGGFDTARTWWRRFGGQELAVFAEEMTVKETRMYVQRVLQTLGIYRWLYAGEPPKLCAAPMLPPWAAGSGANADASSTK